jgi:hypothetical protein
MNPEEVRRLLVEVLDKYEPLREVLTDGVSLNATAYLIFLAGALLSTLFGAYVGSYWSKRGEISAIQKELATIKEQTAELSLVTAQVNAKVSGDLWEKQRRWTTKADLYSRLLRVLMRVGSARRQLELLEQKRQQTDGERKGETGLQES